MFSSNSAIDSAHMNILSRRQNKSIRVRTLRNKSANVLFESKGVLNCKDSPTFSNVVCSSPSCISPSYLLFDELRSCNSKLQENASSSSSTTDKLCMLSPSSRRNGLSKLRCHAIYKEARDGEQFFGFTGETWSSSSCLSPSFICFDELRPRDDFCSDKALARWEVHVDPLFSEILSSENIGKFFRSVSKPLDKESLDPERKSPAFRLGRKSDAFLEDIKVQRVNYVDEKENCVSLPSPELTGSSIPSVCGRKSCTDLLLVHPLPARNEVSSPTRSHNLEGFDDDGPLFWPFDQNCCRYDDLNWDLCISPTCKNRGNSCMTQRLRSVKNSNLQLRRTVIQNNRRRSQAFGPNDHPVFHHGSTKKHTLTSNSNALATAQPRTIFHRDSTKKHTLTSNSNALAIVQPRTSVCNQGIKSIAGTQVRSGDSVLKRKKGTKSRLGVQSSYQGEHGCYNVPTNRSWMNKPGEHACGDLRSADEHVGQLLELAVEDSQVLVQIIFWPIVESMSVEALVGMEEFDGHEGIKSDLIAIQFSSEDSISKNINSAL